MFWQIPADFVTGFEKFSAESSSEKDIKDVNRFVVPQVVPEI